MAINPVVTGGFGSFGTVNLVPTLGFTSLSSGTPNVHMGASTIANAYVGVGVVAKIYLGANIVFAP